jgi:hypothetical protein
MRRARSLLVPVRRPPARILLTLLIALMALATSFDRGAFAAPRRGIVFDDFSYASRTQLEAHGWIVRTAPGWPGVVGATWSADTCRSLPIPPGG